MEEKFDYDFADEETPMTDDEIRENVELIFDDDERIDPTNIDVVVEHGVVYLEGSVSTDEEYEMAESLLDNIEGIQTVQNNLQVVRLGFTPDKRLSGEPEEEEFEGVEVLPADQGNMATEDPIEAIEEGKSFVPPTEPEFPTERNAPAERMRDRRAEEESTGHTKEPY